MNSFAQTYLFGNTALDPERERKVAIYGRVSTQHEAQIDALGNQMQWYEDQLNYHPNWKVIDRYIDEGLTGTLAKKRPSFMRMIEDAKDGNSRQKYLYVPEPQNDFIFSILCEELGFIGAALVVALFLLLLLRGMSIAVRARDKFGALLVVGFVVQVTLQAILNMAVVTNTIPNTGISLPFFSSGGTSLLMLLGEMGIVLSVSRQTDMV